MGRVARISKSKLISVAIVVVLLASGAAVWAVKSGSAKAQTVTNARQQVVQISYHGKNGVNALALLKQKARVTTKHYSFGDLVTSINGSVGNGPKYWTFYVNNKEASVGAGAYVTKNSDTLMWRLQ